jgi:dGTPase
LDGAGLRPRLRARFWRDRDRIVGSRAFRRLAGKTQVVALPSDPLVRTRLTHTLEVSSIAREIGRGLQGLGVIDPLVDAIALGHDLGHPAFGHAGERALASIVPGGFHHAAHGVRVVTVLEPELDLAPTTVEGILKHSKGRAGAVFGRGAGLASTTREASVVRAADLYAYACHDLDDAYLLGELCRHDVPRSVAARLGVEPADVRRALVAHTVAFSHANGDIGLDPETGAALEELRSFLYGRLYEGRRIASQTACVRSLFDWLWQAAHDRPRPFLAAIARFGLSPSEPPPADPLSSETFVDAVAAMADRQVLEVCRRLRPEPRGFTGGPKAAPSHTAGPKAAPSHTAAGGPAAVFRESSP